MSVTTAEGKVLSRKEIEERILEKLNDRGSDLWMQQIQLVESLDISRKQYHRIASILKSMESAGKLERKGTGKYQWRIRKPGTTYNLFGVYLKDAHRVQVKGIDTYKYKDRLSALGCTWNAENRAWEMSANTKHLVKLQAFLSNYDELMREIYGGVEQLGSTKEELKQVEASPLDTFGPVIEKLLKQMSDMEDEIAKLHRTRKVEFTVKLPDKTSHVINGHTHPVFEQVMFHVTVGDSVMLVGPKGCGKTVLCEQIAKALKRDFGMISLSGGVTESKLFGRSVPNITTGKNEFHSAQFLELFEKGGVFLLDEVDAADPNVLLSINSALANGVLAVDRVKNPMARRHKNFVCLAAANTWGNGADRQYVGRNQQDSAFTERFQQLAMDYDEGLELSLCPGGETLVERMHGYRRNVAANKLERTISTRFIVRAYNWKKNGKDDDYVDTMLFAGWRPDEVRRAKGE